jgi:hypothetical protein
MIVRSARRAPWWPFALAGATALAILAWTVWWFVLARQVEARTDAAAAELARAGYRMTWTERTVDGWPYRARLRFEGFRLAAPSGHALAAPRLEAQANAYNLRKWVLAAPDGLTVARGAKGDVRIGGRAIRASVVATDGAVPRVAMELREPVFTPGVGAEPFPLTSAKLVALNLRPTKGSAADADLLFRVEEGVARKTGVLDWTVGGKTFDTVASARIANAAAFRGDRWGEAALNWASRGGALADFRAEAEAGDARADGAAARLTFDREGRLQGTLALTLRNGPGALAALGAWGQGGRVGPGAASGLAATQTGLNGTANLVLVFENGRTRLGPVPLAPAPKLF